MPLVWRESDESRLGSAERDEDLETSHRMRLHPSAGLSAHERPRERERAGRESREGEQGGSRREVRRGVLPATAASPAQPQPARAGPVEPSGHAATATAAAAAATYILSRSAKRRIRRLRLKAAKRQQQGGGGTGGSVEGSMQISAAGTRSPAGEGPDATAVGGMNLGDLLAMAEQRRIALSATVS